MKACSKIIILFILLAFGFSHHALAVVELEGEIVVDTVWSKSLSPYILTDDVIVLEDVSLTIEPGVVVQFNKTGSSDGFHLDVQGTLQARGVVDDPILFTIDDKEYHWGHIEFMETSIAWDPGNQSGCILEYCILEYGGNGRVEASERAAVRVISASPLIQNNVIRYSKNDGIRTVGGNQNIVYNRIHDTTTGIKIVTPDSGSITLNYLALNQQGIYIDSGNTNVEVSNNTVLTASEEGHGAAIGVNLVFHDTLSSYAWEQLTGTGVSLSDPASKTPEFTAPDVPAPESLVFQVTVTDESGLQDADMVQINVGWDNAPPLAIAGNDQSVDPDDIVTLDGSESDDNDDGIATYEWLQTSGQNVGLTPHADPRFATFIAPNPPMGDPFELLVFQITVTDNDGLQDIDTVVVRVNSTVTAGDTPIADAGADQPIYPDPIPVPPPTVNEGDTITLDGSGSSDPDGTIVSYQWESLDTYIEFLTPPVSTDPTVQFVAPSDSEPDVDQTYEFKLTVTDNDGNTSSDNVIINVTDNTDPNPNNRPTADAGADQGSFVEGTLVTLDGSLSTDEEDLDLDPELYRWEQIAGDIFPTLGNNINVSPTRTFTVPEDPQFFGSDEFVFRLTVEDERGLRHTDTTSVFISWTNDPPVAEAGNDQEVIEGEKVLLNGTSSSDPDDGIANYTWTQISGPAVDLSSSGAAKVWFIAPDVASEEVLVFRLRVADSNPRNDNDVTHVTVKPATNGPTADAGSVDPVAFGATVDLSGTATDPDNDIVSYLWEQTDGEPVTLLNATTLTPQFTAPASAEDPFITLTFKLTVTDAEDNTSMDVVLVNVRDGMATGAPDANAGPDQNVSIFDTVTLNASASIDEDAGPDLAVTRNSFAYILELAESSESDDEIEAGNLVALSSGSEANSQLVFNDNNLLNLDGNYSLYLFSWEQAAIDTVNLTGNWWGTTSDAEIEALIFDEAFDLGLPAVTFAAAGAEVGGTGSDLSYPAIADADANDDEDQDDIAKDPDEIATLSCRGYNHPNQAFSYTWQQKQGKSVVLTNANQCNATFIVPEVSSEDQNADDLRTLIFELTVTDAQGFYDSDEVQVTVNEIDDDDDDTHSTTGCFISTVGN